MDRKAKLHEILLQSNPASCWFQPPDNTKLRYPAIVYKRKSANIDYADNISYKRMFLYEIKVFDANPDSAFIDWMLDTFPGIKYVNHYTTEGLNVEVFELYW